MGMRWRPRCFFPGGLDSSTVGPASYLLFIPLLYTALLMVLSFFAFSSTSALLFAVLFGAVTYLSIVMVLYYLMRLLLFHRLRWTRFSLLTHMALALLCILTLYAAQIPFAPAIQKAYQLWKNFTPYISNMSATNFNSQFQQSYSGLPYVLMANGVYQMNFSIAAPVPQTDFSPETLLRPPPIQSHSRFSSSNAVPSSSSSSVWRSSESLSRAGSVSSNVSLWIYAVPIVQSVDGWMGGNQSVLTLWSVSFVSSLSQPVADPSCPKYVFVDAAAPLSVCSVFNGGAFNPQEGQLLFVGVGNQQPSDSAEAALDAINRTLTKSEYARVLPSSGVFGLTILSAKDWYSSYNVQYNIAYDSAIALALAFDVWLIVLMPIVGYALNVHSCTQHGMSTQRADHFTNSNQNNALNAETDRLVQTRAAPLTHPTNSEPLSANSNSKPLSAVEMAQL